MSHQEIHEIVGFVLILAGFSCYFIAAKLWVEGDNRFRLIDHGENEQRFENKKIYNTGIYVLGFMLCSFGLIGSGAVYPYSEESDLDSILYLISCGFYNVVFIWFNVLVSNKYFYRDSILGKWIVGKHEIVFERSFLKGIRGEYNINNYSGSCEKSYKFSCEVNYKRREIRFTWMDIDWKKKDGLPSLVYFGDGSCFNYKIITFKTTNYYLQLDNSGGWMKKQ